MFLNSFKTSAWLALQDIQISHASIITFELNLKIAKTYSQTLMHIINDSIKALWI